MIATYQPVVMIGAQAVAVDTGGDTIVERDVQKKLAHGRTVTAFGRSDRALFAPSGYLAHWYLSHDIRASLGPTWLLKGPVTFDFSASSVTTPAPSNGTSIRLKEAGGSAFFDLVIGGTRHTCLLDTGSVGLLSPLARRVLGGSDLTAVNALEGSAFDRIVAEHPAWKVPDATVTIPADRGTQVVAVLLIPSVTSSSLTFKRVAFVRRSESRTFTKLSALAKTDVDCDAGGALFRDHSVELDLQRGTLRIGKNL